MTRLQRRRGLRARLILALTAALVTLGAIEGWYRFASAEPWWDRVVDEQLGHQEGWEIRDARQGDHLRDQQYARPKPDDHYRILFLGDSFTYGLGVENRDDIFVEILERRLNRDRPDPAVRSYDVLNGSIPGALTGSWVECFQGPGRDFDPDHVVAVFFLRDGTLLGFRRNFFGPIREQMQEWAATSSWARLSAAYRELCGRFKLKKMSHSYVEAFQRSYFGDELDTAEWRRAQDNLLWLRDRCEQQGLAFQLVVFPVLFEFGPDYPFRGICAEVERFGAEHQIPTLALLPALESEDPKELWVSEFDQHPNERGHRLVADALEPWLRSFLRDR